MNIDKRRKSIRLVGGVLGLIFLIAAVFLPVSTLSCFAEEYEMSSEPRLEEARESYEKGKMYLEKGFKEYRGRPGVAQKMFEHAEDYFTKAGYLYKQLGHELGIDTGREVAICEKSYQKAHVQVNKVRNKGVRKYY